jgi:hypothetical protein
MRLVSSVVLALCVALPAPRVAYTSDSVNPVHKQRIQQHHAVPGWFDPAATALVPAIGIVRVAPALKSNDNTDGLSRDRDQCNRGCIDN